MLRVNGRQQRRTIGRYPNLSLASARAAALDMLRGAADGVDPREPAAVPAATLTYAELVDAYVERHLKPNARSWRDIRSSLLHPAFRTLRTRAAAGITRGEIATLIDAVVAEGKGQAAVNLLRRLKMLFNWAAERDLLPANPCERIRPPVRVVERDRVLSDSEIVAVWQACDQLPPPWCQMIRTLMLTGQRRSEVATMRWSEVEGATWVIPREKVKKDRPHAVPLSATAAATLATLPRWGHGAYVFTTTGGASASSNFAKTKRLLGEVSGVSDWRIHDIRRTVRSKLAELGVPRDVARKVLNHEDGKVDRIYNRHEYLAEKREALERWEDRLLAIVAPPSFHSPP
jgi:integrase